MRGATVVLLAAVLVLAAAQQRWWEREKDFVDCFKLFKVPRTFEPGQVQRAAREIRKETHPDRCPTPECESRFAAANNCLETLLDPLLLKQYIDFVDNPPLMPTGPPRTSVAAILIAVAALVSYAHYSYMKREATERFEREAEALRRRQKATPEILSAMRTEYKLDSVWNMARDLWVFRIASFSVWVFGIGHDLLTASTATVMARGPKRDPGNAALIALMHQALKFWCAVFFLYSALRSDPSQLAVVLVGVWFIWGVATSVSGSSSPLYVVRDDTFSTFSRGDLLVLTWGPTVMEGLHPGDVLLFRQVYSDPYLTLSRVTAVHKQASRGKRVIGGDIWIMTKKDGSERDDRQLRLSDTDELYFSGKDEHYPGRVVYRLPAVGLAVLVFGEASVVVYLLGFVYLVWSLVEAGKAAKRAREQLKPGIVRRANSERRTPN